MIDPIKNALYKLPHLTVMIRRGEYYFPIKEMQVLIKEIYEQQNATINIEFFHILWDKVAITPTVILDLNETLREDNWDTIVEQSYERANEVVEKEIARDNTQWGIFEVYTKSDWDK